MTAKACIVVEREFTGAGLRQQRDDSELRQILEPGGLCMEQYGVTPLRHYFAFDRSRVACVFAAPDAEAVRNVGRTAGVSPPKHLWAASVHLAGNGDADAPPRLSDPSHSLVVVERTFPEPVTFEEVQAIEDDNRWCLTARHVAFMRSYFSTDRRRMLCLYEAPDVESVRVANRQAGLPFDLVWGARVLAD